MPATIGSLISEMGFCANFQRRWETIFTRSQLNPNASTLQWRYPNGTYVQQSSQERFGAPDLGCDRSAKPFQDFERLRWVLGQVHVPVILNFLVFGEDYLR